MLATFRQQVETESLAFDSWLVDLGSEGKWSLETLAELSLCRAALLLACDREEEATQELESLAKALRQSAQRGGPIFQTTRAGAIALLYREDLELVSALSTDRMRRVDREIGGMEPQVTSLIRAWRNQLIGSYSVMLTTPVPAGEVKNPLAKAGFFLLGRTESLSESEKRWVTGHFLEQDFHQVFYPPGPGGKPVENSGQVHLFERWDHLSKEDFLNGRASAFYLPYYFSTGMFRQFELVQSRLQLTRLGWHLGARAKEGTLPPAVDDLINALEAAGRPVRLDKKLLDYELLPDGRFRLEYDIDQDGLSPLFYEGP